MKKKLTQISVQTLPNGYAMTINGLDYFEYNELQLLEGAFARIGLQQIKVMDRAQISNLMEACGQWPNQEKSINAAMKAAKELDELRYENSRLKEQVASQTEYINKLRGRTEKLSNAIKQKSGDSTVRKHMILSNTAEQPEPKRIKVQAELPVAEDVVITPKMRQELKRSIATSDLPGRLKAVMMKVGGGNNSTIGEALRYSRFDFVATRGCGKSVMDHLEKYMQENHFAFGMRL